MIAMDSLTMLALDVPGIVAIITLSSLSVMAHLGHQLSTIVQCASIAYGIVCNRWV